MTSAEVVTQAAHATLVHALVMMLICRVCHCWVGARFRCGLILGC